MYDRSWNLEFELCLPDKDVKLSWKKILHDRSWKLEFELELRLPHEDVNPSWKSFCVCARTRRIFFVAICELGPVQNFERKFSSKIREQLPTYIPSGFRAFARSSQSCHS